MKSEVVMSAARFLACVTVASACLSGAAAVTFAAPPMARLHRRRTAPRRAPR